MELSAEETPTHPGKREAERERLSLAQPSKAQPLSSTPGNRAAQESTQLEVQRNRWAGGQETLYLALRPYQPT